MATEIKDKVDFNFDELLVENPMEQPSWQEFTRKVNEMNKDVDFAKVRTGEGSDVNFGHVTAVSITADDIEANTITANEISAGTITADEIASYTITANEISAYTITANRLNVNELSAISADLGSIEAGTITGALIRTSDSGARVILDDSTNTMKITDNNNTVRAESFNDGIEFSRSTGTTSGKIYDSSILGVFIFEGTGRDVGIHSTSSNGEVALVIDGNGYFKADGSAGANVSIKDIIPYFDNSGELGSSTSKWAEAHFGSRVQMYGSSSNRSFLRPDEGDGSNLGTSTYYWHQLYADIVRYKDLGSFDHIDDLEAMKKIKLKTVEREGPQEDDDKPAKKIKTQIWDPKTMPKDTNDKGFYNAGAVNGFLIGAVKELISRVETLESQLKG